MPGEEKRKAIHASLIAGGFRANKIMETNGWALASPADF
jgi:hypothetical protein